MAADPRVWPIGTCLDIEGIGWRLVHDTGSAIKGRRLDVYFTSHEDAAAFGARRLEVKPCGV